jgi:hypothetical protein
MISHLVMIVLALFDVLQSCTGHVAAHNVYVYGARVHLLIPGKHHREQGVSFEDGEATRTITSHRET